MTSDESEALRVAHTLVASLGREGAIRAVDAIYNSMSVVDTAALAYDWTFWARPKQLAPQTDWRSWGFLCGRGFGKSRAVEEHITEEVQHGRAMSIGLCGQKEEKTIDMARALVDVAPPWFRPVIEVSSNMIVWPNGARGYIRTPEAPDAIRSENHHLVWLSEIQSWPVATREEAYSNFMFATRLGYARTVWDATPKRRHPILTRWLERAKADPEAHIIVRGTMRENAVNLGAGVVDELEREFGGTSKGREELDGEMVDDADGALFRQAWFDRNRRVAPDRFARRAIGIDPAVTSRKSSDKTGIIEAGLGVDGQAYALGDYSGQHRPEAWASITLDVYVRNACDVIVAETNKGGDLIVQNLRAAAQKRGMQVVVIGKDDRAPSRQDGIVYVREIYSRGPKEDRAQPVATACEANRISHARDAELSELEIVLTTWEPAPNAQSPDRMDAYVQVMKELLGLADGARSTKAGFVGITQAASALRSSPIPTSLAIEALLRGHRRGL